MKLAITGAAGLIGAHVTRAAIAAGHDATAVVRAAGRAEALDGVAARVVAADVLGPPEPLIEAFAGAEVVVHTAATFAYGGDGEALRRIAVKGTENVLDAAAEAGARRVVVTSSSVVFGYSDTETVIDESRGVADAAGQPGYVAAKIMQDRSALERAERLGLEVVLACPTMSVGGIATTLGPSNAMIVAYLADPTHSTFPGGCNVVAARDVGRGHILLAERGESGAHYLLGSENLRWSSLHALIGVLGGVGGPNMEIGRHAASLAARVQEGLALVAGRASLSTREEASMVGRYYWYDHGRASALGYRPMSAVAALAEAVSWLAASPHIGREVRARIHLSEAVLRLRRLAA
jgi:dihydroflavonol-4-reductase